MQPHLETIQHNKDALILQEIQNKNQNDQISSMKNKISNPENHVSLAICKEAHNYIDLTITDFSNWV
jgi:mannitol-1-phosphate/altronate dehydrogenase